MTNKPVKKLTIKMNNGDTYIFLDDTAEQVCRKCLDMSFNWIENSFTWANEEQNEIKIIYTKNIASIEVFK